jgi:phage shock protein E
VQPCRRFILYTHCVVGKRSVMAAQILRKYGYDVRPLKAGYRELLEAGFKKADDEP